MSKKIDKAADSARADRTNNKLAKKILEGTWNKTLDESTKPVSKHAEIEESCDWK
jgi:hypothetical protein